MNQLRRFIINFVSNTDGGMRVELVRGAIGSFVIRAMNVPLALGVSIVLARALGPEGYGVYAFVFSVTMMLMVLVQMGLPTLVTREVARYQYGQRWGLLRGLLLRANQAVLVLFVLVVLIVLPVAHSRYGPEDPVLATTGAWGLLLLPLMALNLLWSGAIRGLRRVLLGLLPETLLRPGFFLVLLTIAFLGEGLTPPQAMLLHCAATGLAILMGAVMLAKALPHEVVVSKPEYDTRPWFRSALSLSLLTGLERVIGQIGIVMLGLLATKEEVGQYRVVISLGMLILFGRAAIGAVVAPHIARFHSAGDKERLQRMLTWSARAAVLVAFPVAIGFVVFGPSLLSVVYGESYRQASTALAILSIGWLLGISMGPVGLTLNMTGHERETLKGVAVATVLNVILAAILIPPFGAVGAATASSISLITWNLILCRAVWRRLGLQSTPLSLSLRRRQS